MIRTPHEKIILKLKYIADQTTKYPDIYKLFNSPLDFLSCAIDPPDKDNTI